MKFLLFPIWLLITLFSHSSVALASDLSKMKSFEDWCNQRDSLPLETQKTIDYLLEGAGTFSNCQSAGIALQQRTELLTSSPIPLID